MKTIRTDYWKLSSRAAISSSTAESDLRRISLNVVKKKVCVFALLIAGAGLPSQRVSIKLLTDAQPKPCVIGAWRFNNPEEEILMSESFPLPTKPEGVIPSLVERFNSGKI